MYYSLSLADTTVLLSADFRRRHLAQAASILTFADIILPNSSRRRGIGFLGLGTHEDLPFSSSIFATTIIADLLALIPTPGPVTQRSAQTLQKCNALADHFCVHPGNKTITNVQSDLFTCDMVKRTQDPRLDVVEWVLPTTVIVLQRPFPIGVW